VSRPPAEPATSLAVKWVFWITAAAFLPTWLVEQPNPDWRGLSWVLTSEIVLLTLCAIYFVGGKSWLRHFAFSICFILTTLPWPGGLETFLIQGLMHVVAGVTVVLLNLFQIAALQHGNLIEVQTGLLGIDEACCGIRSLQASLMVALLLGELYRATFRRRSLFFLAGILIPFFCNVGRTFFLSWTAAQQGIEAVPKWHDRSSKPKFQTLSLPDLLGDEQRAASWTENDGSRWTALFFKWAAGPPSSRIQARLHRPDNCLPAVGYKLQIDRGIIIVRVKDLMIPFHAMDFECDGRLAYVFFCIWQDSLKSSQQLRIRDHWDGRLVGLESVLLGERNLAQQTLEIVVFGYSKSEEADNALRRQMDELIQL
jgi:exosortase